jgi:hypothetical protein
MASPKNWRRRKKLESKYKPYVWKNTETGQHLMVIGTTGHYEVHNVPSYVNDFSLENLKRESVRQRINGSAQWGNKEDARGAAVDWMEDNSLGEDRGSSTVSYSRQF